MESLMTHHGLIRIVAVAIALLAGIYYMAGGITNKADVYYVHWAGYLNFEPERAGAALKESTAAAPEFEAVYRARDRAATNYLVLAATSYLGATMFPGELVRPMVLAHLLAFVLAVAVLYFAMGAAGPMVPAMGLVIAYYALQSLLTGPAVTDHLLFYGGWKDIMNLGLLILAPGEAFNLLSFWPKSIVLLLAATALCLRANGAVHKAYGVLLIAQLFHVTLSVVFLLGFLVMDLALRRAQLSWRILVPILAISAGMFFRSQWQIFADTGHGPAVLVALGGAIVLAYLLHGAIAPRFARFDTLSADAILIIAAALIFVPASMVIFTVTADDDPWGPASVYLQLATRLLVFAAIAATLWCARFAVQWLEAREALAAEGMLLLIVCGMLSLGAAGAWWWHGKTINARLHGPAQGAAIEPYAVPYYRALEKLSQREKGFTDRPGR